MPDSTDSTGSGLKQGISSLAAFAVPALVAGLFGGGGFGGAAAAGMEGVGTLAEEQKTSEMQAGTMLSKMAQQRQLQLYRQQEIAARQRTADIQAANLQERGRHDVVAEQRAAEQTKIYGQSQEGLSQLRSVQESHLQALNGLTSLHAAELSNNIMRAGGARATLKSMGFPADSYDDKTVDAMMQKVGAEQIANDPRVRDANIDMARSLGVPAATTDAMKSWPAKATTEFAKQLSTGATKGHDSAFTGVVRWIGGTGKNAPTALTGDPKIDAEFANSPLGKAMAGSTSSPSERLKIGKQMIEAIDKHLGVDPTADLAALDRMGAPAETPAPAKGPAEAKIAKPAGPKPAAATAKAPAYKLGDRSTSASGKPMAMGPDGKWHYLRP